MSAMSTIEITLDDLGDQRPVEDTLRVLEIEN